MYNITVELSHYVALQICLYKISYVTFTKTIWYLLLNIFYKTNNILKYIHSNHYSLRESHPVKVQQTNLLPTINKST